MSDAAALDPDVELMLAVSRDEPGAFAQLVARYWPSVTGIFFRMMRDRQESEDLAQEVFLRVYRNRNRYRHEGKLSTWIFFIARNVGRNAHRDRRHRVFVPIGVPVAGDEYSNSLELLDERSAPGRPAERAELARTVRLAMASLSRRQRRALELRCDSHSYSEIATALSVSPNAAKSLLYRARNELRHSLHALADC